MNETLRDYLLSRFEKELPRLGVTSIEVLGLKWGKETNSHVSLFEIPVRFGHTRLGVLKATHKNPESVHEPLESLALQLASLSLIQDSATAIRLDQVIHSLKDTHPKYDWVGIYRLQKAELHLTVFRGPATPHPIIHPDRGICGAAVNENRTLNLPDVTADPRYLACDLNTKSEIVVPIRNSEGIAIAEIDIDSRHTAAFDDADAKALEKLAIELSAEMIRLV